MWKRDGGSEFKDFLTTFGVSDSSEEAMGRIQHALRHGRSRPPQTAHEFRKMVEGGTFYVYAVHDAYPVPRGTFTDPDANARMAPHAIQVAR